MAKLIFRYGAMNSGKTTIMLQTAYNYEERNKKVILVKSSKDTKGDNYVVSRIGLKRKIDEFITPKDKVIDKIEKYLDGLNCIIVDEAQFLLPKQVDELYYITKLYDIPVIAYGLRSNFVMDAFDGSPRFLLLADQIEELPTICRCGKKARQNARKIDGEFVTEGDSVVIDGEYVIVNGKKKKVDYESMCGKCYLEKVLGANKGNFKKMIYKNERWYLEHI